jgi:hypothetical protein
LLAQWGKFHIYDSGLEQIMTAIYPGHRSFYKYASPEAAKVILENKTVRYSSPLTFNDPFDVQTGLHFDFKLEDLLEKCVDHIGRFASASSVPPVDKDHPIGQIALIARNKFPIHGFDKKAWLNMIKQSLNEDLIPIIQQTQFDFQNYWKAILPTLRVFCVSEDRDNLLMWAHYAKDHTGVVFEFLSRPENDNALSVAQQVQYVDSPPPFFNKQEWLDDFIATKPFDNTALQRRYVLHKSRDWSYEKEWRVWYPNSKTEGHHDYLRVQQNEFPAIFIGCRAEKEFTNNIIAMTRKNFPNTRTFKAKRRSDSYTLEYVKI